MGRKQEVVPRNKLGERADAEAKTLADAEKKEADDLALKKAEAERLAAATKKAAADTATARPAAQKAMQEAQAANEAALQKALAWEDDPKRPRVYPKVVLGDRSAAVNDYMAKIKEGTTFGISAAKLQAMGDEYDRAVDAYNANMNSKADLLLSFKKRDYDAYKIKALSLGRLYDSAWGLVGKNDLDAEWAFRTLIQATDETLSRAGLAAALQRQGRYAEAQAEYEAALKLARSEERSNILDNTGFCLLSQNRYEEAAKAYREALKGETDVKTLAGSA